MKSASPAFIRGREGHIRSATVAEIGPAVAAGDGPRRAILLGEVGQADEEVDVDLGALRALHHGEMAVLQVSMQRLRRVARPDFNDLRRVQPAATGPISRRNVYVNFNATFLDTCLIQIGSRTMIGPNCSFYAATHPLHPRVRNGTKGLEFGKPITIGEDCWLGGNVFILPGVTLGNGVVVGAGSVVAKDVPDHHVVAGNLARILKAIPLD